MKGFVPLTKMAVPRRIFAVTVSDHHSGPAHATQKKGGKKKALSGRAKEQRIKTESTGYHHVEA